jgi:hypothetical protein
MTKRFSLPAWILAVGLLALSMMSAPAWPEAARTAVPKATVVTPVAVPVAVPPAIAPEDSVETNNCFDTRNMESCVTVFRGGRLSPHIIAVPPPASEAERAAAEARDRRWVTRCRPTIRQDRYGMPRYSYAAPGCEYGVLD